MSEPEAVAAPGRLRRALRPRVTLNAVLVAVVVVAAFLGIRSLVAGSNSAATDHAVHLVPPRALLYVHLRVDRHSAQWRRAGSLLSKLPVLARFRDQALRDLASGKAPGQLDAAVRPWLGDEAALALLPHGREANSLLLLRVKDSSGAKSFLAGAGRSRIALYRGTQVRLYRTLAAAFLGEFLAIGRPENVRAAIAARAGASLADDAAYREATSQLHVDSPLVSAYAPGDGVRRLLLQQPGIVGRLADLIARPALRGAAAGVRFERRGMRLTLASAVLPQLPGAAGTSDQSFAPQLPRSVPSGAIAYFGVKGLGRMFRQLEALAGGRTSELSRGIARLRAQLGPSGERALARAVAPLDQREAALVVTPPSDAPVVSLIVGDTTQSEGGDVLIALQPLLSRVVSSTSGGQASTLEPGSVGGVDTLTLRLNPDLELTYAAFGDRLVVSTSPDGIRQILDARSALASEDSFAPGMDALLKHPTSLVFLDLQRVSSLIERAGLGDTPEYRAIKPELSRLGKVTAITASERSSQTTQVFIEVP